MPSNDARKSGHKMSNSPPPLPPARRPPVPPPCKSPTLPHLDGLSKDELKRALHDEHKKYLELVNRNGAHRSADNGLPDLIDASDFLAEQIDAPPELIAGILHAGSLISL